MRGETGLRQLADNREDRKGFFSAGAPLAPVVVPWDSCRSLLKLRGFSMLDMSKLSGVYYTVDEAAEVAGVTRGRLSQMIRSGVVKGLRVSGTCWLVSEREAQKVRKESSRVGRPRLTKMAG